MGRGPIRSNSQPAAGVPDRRQVGMRFRQPQQRRAAIGMARTQPVEGSLGTVERGVQRLVGDAVRADLAFKRVVDGLDDSHGCGSICL